MFRETVFFLHNLAILHDKGRCCVAPSAEAGLFAYGTDNLLTRAGIGASAYLSWAQTTGARRQRRSNPANVGCRQVSRKPELEAVPEMMHSTCSMFKRGR